MPSKKKKYNARFPAGRIKKIMQSDEEIGKVAQAVPVIISRTLELFVESLLTKTLKVTNSRNAKTLSPSHMKQCIMSEASFDFLRELVKNIPDISVAEEAANYTEDDARSSPDESYPDSDTPYDLSMPSTSSQAYRNNNAPQNGSHYKPPQNGGALTRCESEVKQRLRQKITAAMETAVSNPMPVMKLNRSESTPAPAHATTTSPAAEQWLKKHQLMLQRQLLKHPFPGSDSNANVLSPAKRPKLEQAATAAPPTMHQQQPETAISAPIVSFDFYNKPVVKIDYSNLPLSHASVAPLSAPASTGGAGGGAFNFSDVSPVINIDLSNIVPTPLPANGPAAMATISIGAIPNAVAAPTTIMPAAIANTTTTTKLASSPLTTITPNPKATMATPFTLSQASKNTAAAAAASAASAAKLAKPATLTSNNSALASKNSFLELDEDYDNI